MNASEIQELITQNAASYERLNSIISAGRSSRWNQWVAKHAVRRPNARVLDVFSGTGPVGLEAAALGAKVTIAANTPQLLTMARHKATKLGVNVDLELVNLSRDIAGFSRASFDAVTMAFSTRYRENPAASYPHLVSLLKPGGRLVILEYVVPSGGLTSKFSSVYFFHVLPMVAALASKHRKLFTLLTQATKARGCEEDLELMLLTAGLSITEVQRFGFGLAYGVVSTHGSVKRFDAIA
ncbi:MAG: hypothetical protein A2074_04685 [Candidatus Aquicultor primus]|uniref:Methyltransferase domain-containing protein n=1 Tax=Candidatus Aquicultor primus TaxID=1797195 RepID=A0A1F2UID1_9ACTN|nr:MAG: hypothetical protein A2074_04685 [Candidatus Aquicultor primus]